MLLDIAYVPNYPQNTWQRKQKRINYDNIRENSKRVSHGYKVSEHVYILRDGNYHHVYILRDGNYRKLEGDKQGPYPITEMFTNGTIRIQKGIMNDRLNIHQLTLHFGAINPLPPHPPR